MSTAAFAKTAKTSSSSGTGIGMEVDGSLGFGTGPGNFDPGLGLNFGAGYTIPGLDNLQARVDISYFDFSYSVLGNDLSFTRIPITFSARYYFPITNELKAFAQGGLEVSVDKIDTAFYYPTFLGFIPVKQSVSETNVGGSIGGGIEYFIIPQASIFALGRVHIISDNYFSMHFGGAFHF